ncbi:uncharacterized protein LOC111278269 [Durio zibethinus]|uniref:Uncharacterized protein LOC111278269 n=1 Tax=Durio zibethinus TaxID=66656 RepID=A0A6P5WWX9_DURZI|nr:uncharacterized protein LOC111278269 [Durio zibethinus]
MGNCIKHENSSWADEHDWGSLVSTHRQGDGGEITIMDKEKMLGAKRDANTREVKITSRKELEQLVQKVDMQSMSLELVLARMIKGGDVYEVDQHRSWKPVLQSIPE